MTFNLFVRIMHLIWDRLSSTFPLECNDCHIDNLISLSGLWCSVSQNQPFSFISLHSSRRIFKLFYLCTLALCVCVWDREGGGDRRECMPQHKYGKESITWRTGFLFLTTCFPWIKLRFPGLYSTIAHWDISPASRNILYGKEKVSTRFLQKEIL